MATQPVVVNQELKVPLYRGVRADQISGAGTNPHPLGLFKHHQIASDPNWTTHQGTSDYKYFVNNPAKMKPDVEVDSSLSVHAKLGTRPRLSSFPFSITNFCWI